MKTHRILLAAAALGTIMACGGGHSGAPAPNTLTAAIATPSSAATIVTGTPLTFTATAKDSSAGTAVTGTWDFGDGNQASGLSATHVFDLPAYAPVTRTVTFTATDPTGASAKATLQVTVNPAAASTLSYEDPTGGMYRLVLDPSSTPTQVVLDLVSTGSLQGSGLGVQFTADPARVLWAPAIANGSVFNLGPYPQIIAASVKSGTLTAALSQKGTASPVPFSGPLAQVSLFLAAGAFQGPVSLSPGTCKVVTPTGIESIQVSVGTLTAR